MRLSDDPDVNEVIKFLRQREVVHFQRFGEAKLTNSNRFYVNFGGAEGITSAPPIIGALRRGNKPPVLLGEEKKL